MIGLAEFSVRLITICHTAFDPEAGYSVGSGFFY